MTSSPPVVYPYTGPASVSTPPPIPYVGIDWSALTFVDPTKPPVIESLDDIVSIQEMGTLLHMKPATLRKYMRGYEGKPPMPYVRIARTPHFSKRQVAWWLSQIQALPDTMMVNVRRAHNERGN